MLIDQLNQNASRIVHSLKNRADSLRIRNHNGCIFDFGVDVRGGLLAGIELARICLGDAGIVNLIPGQGSGQTLIQVLTDQPGIACMGSQYGGWPVKTDVYFAIGSGPIRLRRGKEKVLGDYDWFDSESTEVVGVLEGSRLPGGDEIEYIANECDMDPARIILCVAPTKSLAGTIQIVARSVEATMHKLFELNVDLLKITNAMGTAPLPPVSENDLIAIGRTNDAILYGGCVTLWVDLTDEEINEIGPGTPSNSSSEFGKPFGEIFPILRRRLLQTRSDAF